MSYKWDIYRNLTAGGYSVIDRKTGRVAFRAEHILAHDCALVVQKAGRLRVQREKRKNVHAFVRCSRVEFIKDTEAKRMTDTRGKNRISYSPYGAPTFVRIPMRGAPKPVTNAKHIVLTSNGVGVELDTRYTCDRL